MPFIFSCRKLYILNALNDAVNYFNTFVNNDNGLINNNGSNPVVTNNVATEQSNLLNYLVEAMSSLKVLYEENKGLNISLLILKRVKNEILSAKMR